MPSLSYASPVHVILSRLRPPLVGRFVAHWLAAMVLLSIYPLAQSAEQAAVVTSVAGQVTAQQDENAVRRLSKDSGLFLGDTVITALQSAVRFRFTDDTRVTLRPNSRFTIEQYRFSTEAPKDDLAVVRLMKGGLRTVTGLVGKRGNTDAHLTRTPVADIGIRGTDYALLLCDDDEALCNNELMALGSESASGRVEGKVPPGLYVKAFEGIVVVFNRGGEKVFEAGQAGYVANAGTAPVALPADPGLERLVPPTDPMPGVTPAKARISPPAFPRQPEWSNTFWDISSP